MRSDTPIPGNPWPHDMQITVDDRPHSALEMLWLREAFGLRITAEGPPPLLDTPAPATRTLADDERGAWQQAWPRVWDAVMRHAATEHDPAIMDELMLPTGPSEARTELLRQLAGPSWRDEVDAEAFDDASYADWERRALDAHIVSRPQSLADNPEGRDLEALIPAWERGLTKIVTIPCHGAYTRTVSPVGLVMTARTRADSDAYRAALRAFAP